MKPGASKGKGQRSIQSFLFKPKAAVNSASEQAKPEQRILGEKQASAGTAVIPPNKKPRLSRNTSQQQAPNPVNSTGREADVPADTSQPIVVDHDVLAVPASDSNHAQPQQPSQHSVPARVEQRHQRFQQKLVMGAGNRTYRETQKLNAITKPKYTPLELQIVELKEKHSGVLLIVEVSSFPLGNSNAMLSPRQPMLC